MATERHPKIDSQGPVPIGRALHQARSAPALPPASPSMRNTPEWQTRLATIGKLLSEEAIRARVNLTDPQELFRFETLVQDATRALSAEAVQVAIDEHRKHSPFMPALCDLMQHSAEWRRDQAADGRRQRLMQEERERRALPAPKMTPEQWDAHVAALLAELAAAPGPASPFTGKAAGPPRDWTKPPAHSDLSPELKAMAIEKGWAREMAPA